MLEALDAVGDSIFPENGASSLNSTCAVRDRLRETHGDAADAGTSVHVALRVIIHSSGKTLRTARLGPGRGPGLGESVNPPGSVSSCALRAFIARASSASRAAAAPACSTEAPGTWCPSTRARAPVACARPRALHEAAAAASCRVAVGGRARRGWLAGAAGGWLCRQPCQVARGVAAAPSWAARAEWAEDARPSRAAESRAYRLWRARVCATRSDRRRGPCRQ